MHLITDLVRLSEKFSWVLLEEFLFFAKFYKFFTKYIPYIKYNSSQNFFSDFSENYRTKVHPSKLKRWVDKFLSFKFLKLFFTREMVMFTDLIPKLHFSKQYYSTLTKNCGINS